MTALGGVWSAARRLAVGSALVLPLVGCAGGVDTVPGSSSAGTAAEEELTGQVTVFAAASLSDVFGTFETRFEELHPRVDVLVSFAGSSSLAEQIRQGAPADVFASADLATMASVEDDGAVSGSTAFTSNSLELVVPVGNPAGVTGLADLARSDLAIALCAEEVPCGAATVTLLDAVDVEAAPDTLEQDVTSVLTKVRLGEADAGLVYRTDVLAAGDAVEGIAVDGADDVVNVYPIAVLADAPNPDAADAFVDFVLSDEARGILDGAGFGAP
ncbi:molybdate ABC transporter substrate-binding protein [Labedella phragmitis]|uniref:Molybdate ABC transporter substrate-binding protein n=1 Tax=Labedella phragmitis TaxID=2498849 RepID=A0A444PUG5_9MICO|nr:molybdate ABC transporter substrate-binding protein [Labedella phragmitis]RWZ51503.1 molybdate ABC transporter substrate-binding protein [Labedella phragmitis]